MHPSHATQIKADAVRDQRIERLVPLVSPQELFDELPLDDAGTACCSTDAPTRTPCSTARTTGCW